MDQSSDVPPLGARLLGPTDLRVGDRMLTPRDWPRRQARSILLQLLGTPGHRLPRDVVLDAHWPGQDLDTSLNALYKALHTLRRVLEPRLRGGGKSAYIDVSNETIAIRPHAGLWVDADRFDRLLQQAEGAADSQVALRAALALYRGDFVADEPFVDWPIVRRESLRAARVRATLMLAQLDMDRGEPLASLGYLEALLAVDPGFQEAHRAIIRAFLASGQRALALQQVEQCRLANKRQPGVALDPETEELAQMVRSHSLPMATHPGEVPHRALLNLPGLPTATVGREREIERLRAILADAGTRLVTIVGTGGVGKTRLAMEVARDAGSGFADGVVFVDLASIRSTGLLYPTIAAALQAQEIPGQSLQETVRVVLSRRRVLLVLDNLEHLPGVANPVASLLADVPTLKILATSREPLCIGVGQAYSLDPLAVPEGRDLLTEPERLRKVASVALFLQCAGSWGPPLETDDSVLAIIGTLCQRLDGLPLAIELAAARCWMMRPADILGQLDDRFGVLRDGPRDLPVRHQTLYATIAWSYDLLGPAERELFRGLAVFAGGIDPDALRALFGEDSLLRVEALADKNLLRWEQREGVRRAVMLESVREFAERKLADTGELALMQLAHAGYFAGLLPPSGTIRIDDRQLEWVRRLERDHDNIHLALSVALEYGRADIALRLISGLGLYWFTHGYTSDARGWIDEALAIAPDVPSEDRAWAALWGSMYCWRVADAEAGERFERQAREAWSALGSIHGVARVEHAAAIRMGVAAQFDRALRAHSETLPIFQEVGDGEGIVFSHAGIAHVLGLTGDPAGAVRHLEDALAASREFRDLTLESFVLARLPMALLAMGEGERAARQAAEGERIARMIGDQRSLPWGSVVQAILAGERGDHTAAMEHAQIAVSGFQDAGDGLNEWLGAMLCASAAMGLGERDVACGYALNVIQAVRTPTDTPILLLELAGLALALGYPGDALRTHASGMLTAERMGMVFPERAHERYRAIREAARARLSEKDAAAALRQGEQVDVTEALDLLRHRLAPPENSFYRRGRRADTPS